ncbi:hypothetical protein FHS74_003900 [Nitrospirillum iridis]|uniref:DUF2889 domain-containing protein n=2 Tax=Nitrospirillum iridis TaxID=765888 RepID=A0A7X0B1N3_9PROT|nr:hypothetical protein [Nitrospirillum iridis]
MSAANILPGFRRRFIVRPLPGRVESDVEDDYHCMGIILHHAHGVATRVEATMRRVPWTTCPGAAAVIQRTFTGVALAGFVQRGEKLSNCTHLFDLALLAAAHAYDDAPTVYDILVSDPVDDVVQAELRLGGRAVMAWTLSRGAFTAPDALAGMRLDQIGPWISGLGPAEREWARLLRWGTMLAHGRVVAFEKRTDKSRLPLGQCYTFQPETVPEARYVTGTTRDFNSGPGPLAGLDGSAPSAEQP